jgi:hypothetical protein
VAPGLAQIDWQAPWLAPVAALGQQVAARCAAGWPLPEALNACAPAGGAPVRFVPQSELPAGEAYESYIFHSKQCPTREGLHDFFNGLMWHRFPRTKARLNQLQAAQIGVDGIGQVRGPLRDALTLFDENMAFLRAPRPLWDALLAKRWPVVFGDLRPLWAQSQLQLFGHALLEKLVLPRKAITAHVLLVQPGTEAIADLDAWVATTLSATQLAAKPFANLPVLGVPGWWPANEDPAFYQDPAVFRAPQ